MSVSAAAYHHNGVADQAVKLRVDHRAEQASDCGGALLARGGSLLWLLARCYAVREEAMSHTDWMSMSDVWYVIRHPSFVAERAVMIKVLSIFNALTVLCR